VTDQSLSLLPLAAEDMTTPHPTVNGHSEYIIDLEKPHEIYPVNAYNIKPILMWMDSGDSIQTELDRA
jgi:hypothetical protein